MQTFVNLVVFEDDVTDEQKQTIKDAGLTLHLLSEIIAKGKEVIAAGGTTIKEPEAEDCFMLSYTSGTTGVPKGVKLTHKMLINDSYAINARVGMGDFAMLDETDSYISYLPAAHSFEQAL